MSSYNEDSYSTHSFNIHSYSFDIVLEQTYAEVCRIVLGIRRTLNFTLGI